MINWGGRPTTKSGRMLNRTKRHSLAWRAQAAATDARLRAEFAAALKLPHKLVTLQGIKMPPLTDTQDRLAQRAVPTGRMREQVRRNLFAASTIDAVLAAVEARYRPSRTTWRVDEYHGGRRIELTQVHPALTPLERRRADLRTPNGRARRHLRRLLTPPPPAPHPHCRCAIHPADPAAGDQ